MHLLLHDIIPSIWKVKRRLNHVQFWFSVLHVVEKLPFVKNFLRDSKLLITIYNLYVKKLTLPKNRFMLY